MTNTLTETGTTQKIILKKKFFSRGHPEIKHSILLKKKQENRKQVSEIRILKVEIKYSTDVFKLYRQGNVPEMEKRKKVGRHTHKTAEKRLKTTRFSPW